MIVSMSLTERCNLACDYCYASLRRGAQMSTETADRVVDFAVSATPPGDTLDLGFFGGEPFLRLDLMRRAGERARRRAAAAGVPLRLRVTTNGTLLDDEALDFVTELDVGLSVSIDGPPRLHDLHRRFANGTGSAAIVVANLRRALARHRRVQVNCVFGPDAVESLPETVSFLDGLGVRLIHLNPDVTATWPRASHARLRAAYFGVADRVIACYEAGRPLAVNRIDNKIILFLKGGYAAEDRCGMGQRKIGFGANGDMYPCERLIGHGRELGLRIGSAARGRDPKRLTAIGERTGNRNPECVDCALRRFCMNWCGCTNFFLSGQTDVAAPVLCASEKAAIGAAQHALDALRQNDLFIGHMMAYLREGMALGKEFSDARSEKHHGSDAVERLPRESRRAGPRAPGARDRGASMAT